LSDRLFAAIALACVMILSATAARPAAAAVTLRSAEITREAKTLSAGPIPITPDTPRQISDTVTGPDPFPNDADNFARVGAEGLSVGADGRGTFSHAIGNFLNESASDYRFRVVFDLDEPARFSYSQAVGGPGSGQGIFFDGDARLQRDDDPPLLLFQSGSGTLAPGRYTFSGDTNLVPAIGSARLDRFFAENIAYSDVRLTVAPEPTALSLLLLGGALLCRRRR
jgi:hypothetical protein